ncbi:hypothetical protein OSTOST_09007 [Ostertagia ostertagi]
MSSSTTKATLKELKMLFARFGNPRVIVSDNETQFTSREFKEFSCDRRHRTHPFTAISSTIKWTSGAEASASLLKLKEGERTPCTSIPGQLSPAELFRGRQIKTTLTLLKETTEGEKRTKKCKNGKAIQPSPVAPKKIVQIEETSLDSRLSSWTQAMDPGTCEESLWTSSVRRSDGEGQLWRRHANQMRLSI